MIAADEQHWREPERDQSMMSQSHLHPPHPSDRSYQWLREPPLGADAIDRKNR